MFNFSKTMIFCPFRFSDAFMETVTGEKKERYILVSRLKNKEDKLKKEKDKQAAEKLELEAQVGFTNIIQAISESGKLVVGHNMFLDVIHCINQFHSCLPPDIDDFKELTKAVFPRILDTKLMVNTHPYKEHFLSTSLEEVKITVNQPPFCKVKIGKSYYYYLMFLSLVRKNENKNKHYK